MSLIANLLARIYLVIDALIDWTIVLSYGNTFYNMRRTFMWDEGDLDVDLTGKACAITGANSGIGLATADCFDPELNGGCAGGTCR